MSSSLGANAKELLFHAVQRRDEDPALGIGQEAHPGQHLHVRVRAREVVGGEAPVEREAHGEREELVGGTLTEATVPERLAARRRVFAHDDPGPWRRDHVSAERPQSRTKPSESWWRKASSASYVARSWS